MRKKVLLILIFAVISIGIYYINNNDNYTNKTISYNGNNLRISIDGESSDTLPTSGNYYLVDYDCSSSSTKVDWDRTNYELQVSNGNKKAGVVCNLKFKSKPLLSEMAQGSYVSYIGDSANGCDNTNVVNGWTSCSGRNANYENNENMGFCYSSFYKFHVNGWRIGYVEDGSVHLISAGATDCMCSNSIGTASNNSDNCGGDLSSSDLYKHHENMNNIAFKYCNKNYVKGGTCVVNSGASNTVWAFNAEDFSKITGSKLNQTSCEDNNLSNRYACGYNNDLIDNGGYYWIATQRDTYSMGTYFWYANYRYIANWNSRNLMGVRPIIALESSITVVDGDGTYESPYLISNDYFKINNGSEYISSNDDKSQVQLTLNSSGDAAKMCISVNTSVCTNYVTYSDTYVLDLSSEVDGEKVVYVYYKDSNGDIVASMNKSIVLDTAAPTNNIVSITSESGIYATLTLSSTGADYMCLSDTSNSLNNCTKWVDYSSKYDWVFSDGTGTKNLFVFFKDEASNVSSVVSDSMTCTSNCYKYYMDAYSNSYIYLMRSDGATARTSTGTTDITWYTENSQSMNVCGAYNYSSNGRIWCIGNDNNAYYKTSYSATSWSMVNISSSIDTTNYTYFIYPYSTNGAYVVRSDGRANFINTSGLASESWDYGSEIGMATCSGYSSTIICLGVDGNYYYKYYEEHYRSRPFVKLTNRTNVNSWIDMHYSSSNSYTNIIMIDSNDNKLYNARFIYNTSTTPTWYMSAIPGGAIKTCNSDGGTTTYNYCLGYDGYLYYKTYSTTSWTKSSLSVS